MPPFPDGEPWLLVEASDDGRFFGTGCGRTPGGDDVFYISAVENDGHLEEAINAATAWAEKRGVPRIWIKATPD
ncbi:hypothetical protein [Sphingomonas sp. IC4-52]|uniref:hypothetical protein n=1 Tax=Sphingomonas sp. IC4-52 TaxID=2887202 RepID=UPI001D0F9A9B|nr:hypothetical protein [Sphingomonas sp. IC4-52]MCC2981117.1 hypothetical protein [Sphingomonas sp. IC4-52]